MIEHTHDDPLRLTFGCPGCVERAEAERIANAPMRRATWRCTYLDRDGGLRDLTFTRTVAVPDGWTPDQVAALHVSEACEAFVMALPDDIPMDDTSSALDTMEVERVTIGELVSDDVAPDHVQESLL